MPMLVYGLTILFVGLKLTDQIDWSWWWVLSPLWFSLGVFLATMVVIVTAGLIAHLKDMRR